MNAPAPLGPLETVELLGEELFKRLTGRNAKAVIDHAAEHGLPPATGARVALLGEICAYLVGSYDRAGVRAWFDRSRPQLWRGFECSPADFLWHGQWSAEDEDSQKVLELAKSLAA